jgi:YidC/Oxa1 family membrane protein insertase
MIVAVVLSLLILLFWSMFFTEKKSSDQNSTAESAVEKTENTEAAPKLDLPRENGGNKTLYREASDPNKIPKKIRVETNRFIVELSEQGGALTSIKLLDYREELEKESDPKELVSPRIETGTILNGFENGSVPGIDDAVYTSNIEKDNEDSKRVVFRWTSNEGITVTKTYVFHKDSYLFDLNIAVNNDSGNTLRDKIAISMLDAIPEKTSRIGFSGPSLMIENQVE